MGARHAWLIVLFLAAACAAPGNAVRTAEPGRKLRLFDPETIFADEWQHLPLKGETDWRMAVMDGRVSLRASGRTSASGLIRRVHVDSAACPILEWSWLVTRLQPGADLRVKDREDVGASVFLLFGDPGFLADPKPVPTLRYVWTNKAVPEGSVIDNPYMPGTVRSVVVRRGDPKSMHFVIDRRHIAEDFERAFGTPPPGPIEAIALFTDNDQTAEPVEAYYGTVRVFCGE